MATARAAIAAVAATAASRRLSRGLSGVLARRHCPSTGMNGTLGASASRLTSLQVDEFVSNVLNSRPPATQAETKATAPQGLCALGRFCFLAYVGLPPTRAEPR